ncbi:MATE family efflux transporter [Breznakiella homolactica]|uniref:Multidrug export protein MepA n=1 Tax=Breznakiella homolactica TaxID=2798577 RepID=A0A7T7XQV3_9SPIR|nr:MATE family efflux transporter [Breznakiella homolactica]QQO10723.1 MATE family efflux transporter [Breznakiella homolactica]
MNGHNKKTELLGSAPIPKALLAMGVPTMAGMMINALYNLADAYFVGGLGTSQMAAVSVAFPLSQVIVGFGLLFGNGAASYIARLLGNGEKEKAGCAASTALYSSLFAVAVLIICTVTFLNPILIFLGATESILPYAAAYTRIYIAASIFCVFNVTMNNIVTSEGAAKTTMFTMLAGAVLNVILDPIFIYDLGLGIAGAAYATAISQLVSALVYLRYIFGKKSVFSFHIRDFRMSKEMMAEILKIGIPTLVFQLLTSLAAALINMKAADYGDSVIAGMGAVTRIMSLGSLIVFGFIKGFQPIAGYAYGAKNYGRLNEAVKTSVLWTTLFCVLFGLVLILFPGAVVSLFTKDDTRLVLFGKKALRANGLSFMLFGFYTVFSSLFLALGKAKEGFFLGICRQGLCFIPVILTAPALWGVNGILYAQPIADAMAAAAAACMSAGLYRELSAAKAYSISSAGGQAG